MTAEERAAALYESYLGRTINVWSVNYTYNNGQFKRYSEGMRLFPGLLCVVGPTPEYWVVYRKSGRIESRWDLVPLTNRPSLRGCSEYWINALAFNDDEMLPCWGWEPVDDWFGGRSLRGNHAGTR